MSTPTDDSIEDYPPDFTTDEGDEYVRLSPGRFEEFDDVDALSVIDPGSLSGDVLIEGREH